MGIGHHSGPVMERGRELESFVSRLPCIIAADWTRIRMSQPFLKTSFVYPVLAARNAEEFGVWFILQRSKDEELAF